MRAVPLLPLLCFAVTFAWAPARRGAVVAPARRGAVALGAAPPVATPPERRGVVARLRVAGLFLRYYASPVALAALSVALAPRARAARRGSGAAPRDAALALWRGSKGGGGKVEARCAYFLDALGPWRRVRTFRSLAFDRAQREPGAAPYSYAAFHVACAACLAAPEATREVPAAAAADAFRDATPVMCAALQDAPGNMAGEGKLLNIYHTLQRALDLDVAGDVVELGCHAGTTASMLACVLRRRAPGKRLHLYDSFEGLPAGDAGSGDPPAYGARRGSMRASVAAVAENFARAGLPPPGDVHVGWFAKTTTSDELGENPREIAFAHLDGDLYGSILESLAFVYPRLARGALVVVDDYCDPAILHRHDIFPGAYRACADFFADKPESMVVLPAPHPGYAFPMQYECHAYFQKL